MDRSLAGELFESEAMTKSQLPYEMMRRLSHHRHFAISTISDCAISIAAENNITLSDDERREIVERVVNGFEVVRGMRIKRDDPFFV